MNFFEHQSRAHRNTWLLILYFLAAVILIVAAVNVVVLVGVFQQYSWERLAVRLARPGPMRSALMWTTGGTAALILLGSLFKIVELSGGRSIAAALGGRLIQPDTTDQAERRFVNVVEEMSLASGIPVPFLYVLPGEMGINAFAAGTSPNTASIAVSQGTLENLTRDELQGVVAHEFSHIFNGDMNLNLKLLGVLNGILLIAVIGRGIMRGRPSSSSRRNKGGGGILLVGVGLFVVGYIGVFFAQLIKSAISRQREFLADASAVQFTRNPSGILGALLKIRNRAGSRLETSHAEEVSHMLFASGLSSFFATHPPIEDRIRAIAPSVALDLVPAAPPPEAVRSPRAAAVSGFAGASAPVSSAARPSMAEAVGAPSADSLAAARGLLGEFPAESVEALHSVSGARAAVYALLLSREDDVRLRQLASLGEEADAASDARIPWAGVGARGRLPMLELACPALRAQSAAERGAFMARVHALILEDNRTSMLEALIESFLRRALGLSEKGRSIREDFVTALSCLAHAGHPRAASLAEAAFCRAMAVEPGLRAVVIPALELDVAQLPRALGRLANGDPEARLRVMESAAACALSDGNVTEEEWEILRIFAAALDCPLPPTLSAS